ncbi:MAG: GntP family permease [Eggerthellaceae bacterium]|nr:GntP family permease [Eggerthellaceae bacterium]
MEWIGVIGIFAGLIFFVIAAMKGYNVLVTSIITAVIIILTNGMDLASSILGTESSYSSGLASFIRSNMLIFLFSAILGQYLDDSGAAKSIAQAIMSKIGTKSPYLMLLGVAAVAALLTYGGVSMFVAMFAVIPLARVMFRECVVPWHLFNASWTLGAGAFTMAMIPGVPSVANINATNMCGVSLASAPIMGIVGSLVCIALSCVYIKFALKRCEARGEVYEVSGDAAAVRDESKPTPGLLASLAPLVAMIAIILIGSALGVKNVVYVGMVVAVVLCMVLFNRFIDSQREVLGVGAKNSLGPAVFTSAAVGVGAVASAAIGFSVIQDAIFNMPGGTYVSAATLAAMLGGIMGSGSGAVGIIAQNFIDPYLASGVDPAALAKIVATAAGIGGALPNSGAMFGMFAAMGLTHRNAYKHNLAISIGACTAGLVVMILMANVGII